jgi:predicted AAA+ superfamily ATPase
MIMISGSSSKLLSREIATSLRGRSISYTIMPFSFSEYLRGRNVKVSMSGPGKARINTALNDYLRFGGFPEVVLEDSVFVKSKILRQYVEVMLFRDVVERYGVKNIELLKLLMAQMIHSSAKQFSINRFYNFLKTRGTKADKNSLYMMKDHLIDAFGFIELKRIDGSFRTINQGLSKIYPIDTGYMTDYGMDLANNRGRFLETCVMVELKRRSDDDPGTNVHYWQENSEVDFVVLKKGKVIDLIQVCSEFNEDGTLERELRGLCKASEQLDCNELTIVTYDDEKEILRDGKTVKIVPIWKFLLKGQIKHIS